MRPASFRAKRGSMRGSFHGNRANSFRSGSMGGRKGSMRGSFRIPKQGPPGTTQGRMGSSMAMIKPKVETNMVRLNPVEQRGTALVSSQPYNCQNVDINQSVTKVVM